MDSSRTLTERFTTYFDRNVAQTAARPIGNGAEMEFHVGEEVFTFTKQSGKNAVLAGPARSPQLIFTMAPEAAESILAHPAENVGEIGVHIAKLMISPNANLRVGVQFKAGFFSLFTQGYFGVLTQGGSQFASFLASQGLSGMNAIQSFLGKKKP